MKSIKLSCRVVACAISVLVLVAGATIFQNSILVAFSAQVDIKRATTTPSSPVDYYHRTTDDTGDGMSQIKIGVTNATTTKSYNGTTKLGNSTVNLSARPLTKDFNISDYRLCRVSPRPTMGEDPVLMKGLAMQLEYQCAGDIYGQFVYKLRKLIRSETKRKRFKSRKWGRREHILPYVSPNVSTKERAILIMGNSHTRQITSNLLCQYKDQIVNRTILYSEHPHDDSVPVPEQATTNIVMIVEFTQNLKIYVAANVPFVYSYKWATVMEDVLQRPLKSFDAIVVGHFNGHGASKGTTFEQNMKELQQSHLEWELDFQHIEAPTLAGVAKMYDGPIVWMGMFAHFAHKHHQKAVQQIKKLKETQNRTQLYSINSRQYVEKLKLTVPDNATTALDECAADVRARVDTCNTNTSSNRYHDGHRCMGSSGGHADLVSWDLLDVFHEMFRSPLSDSPE